MVENWQRAGFGIYVHWPFCEAKCPYCDFNSHVVRSVDHAAWRNAFVMEIDRWGERLGPRSVSSIFFGGGTPSLMEPETVAAVISAIARRFSISNSIEITLEANPGSVEADKFSSFAAAGVNRVSLGIQALNDADLKALGRLHTTDAALRALDIAQTHFDRVSFDLIYARQHQTLADWDTELSRALRLGTDHLSLYQLTIEDGTAFGDRFARGKLAGLPDDDLGADMFTLTQARCDEAGLHAYEVSNHARPGAAARHNMIYWRGGDYLGIGPGAHGRVSIGTTRLATIAPRHPRDWLDQATHGIGWEEESLSAQDVAIERLLMGLRLDEPIDLTALYQETEFTISSNKINDLSQDGLISIAEDSLIVTPKGRPLLNAILSVLLGD